MFLKHSFCGCSKGHALLLYLLHLAFQTSLHKKFIILSQDNYIVKMYFAPSMFLR